MTGSAVAFSGGWLVALLSLLLVGAGAAWLVKLLRRPAVGMPIWGRRTLSILWVVLGGIVCALVARVIGALAMAFPAVIWSLLTLVCAGVVGTRLRSSAYRWLAALVVIGASLWGTRFEAASSAARGYAQTGPILGVHPFQSTSIAIDGYGPFDLPVNDYVEADGSRGYGPQALADVFETALHTMAEVHFGNGPARAHQAFAGAQVEVVRTAPVQERLDRVPEASEDVRLVVHSGTVGQRSRVAFACPGRRLDPRGMQPDRVLEQMCPGKYTSEASAGLGVTGRWTGYVEVPGNERLGLGPMLGWTRSNDPLGRRQTLREQWGWAWIVLVVGLACALRQAASPVLAIAGRVSAYTLVAVTCAAGFLLVTGEVAVPLLATPAIATGLGWLPLAAMLGLLALAGPFVPAAYGRTRWFVVPVWPMALGILAATILCSQHLAASEWVVPELWYHRGPGLGAGDWALALERWVLEVADRLGGLQVIAQGIMGGSEVPNAGLGLAAVQNLIASALITLLLGSLIGTIRSVGLWCRELVPTTRVSVVALGRLAAVVVCAIAAGLVMSRQTAGASLLLPFALLAGALCIATVAGHYARGVRGLLLRSVFGGVAASLAIWALVWAMGATSYPGLFLTLMVTVCGAVVLATWLTNVRGESVSSAPVADNGQSEA